MTEAQEQCEKKGALMAHTIGTVMSVTTAIPETSKKNNSKWAVVSYCVNGKRYLSEKRVQVPLHCRVGSQVKIYYHKNDPGKVYPTAPVKTGMIIAAAIICFFVIAFRI